MKLSLFRPAQGATAVALLLALGLGFSSCKKDDSPNTYTGENKIHLALPDGTQTQVVSTDQTQPIEVVLQLTQRTQQALTIDLSLEGNGASYLQLAESRVTIPAGSSSARARLLPKGLDQVSEERSAVLSVRSSLKVEGSITFQILPLKQWTPTSAQTALLEGYKAQGYDLSKLLGYHTVKGEADIAGFGDYEYGKQGSPAQARVVPIQHETMLIELSEKATASQPVLKISYNAFGLNKLFKELWYTVSIGDEYNFNDTPGFAAAKAINWSQTSAETFNVVLDNIRLNLASKTFTFTGHRSEGVPAAIKKVFADGDAELEDGPIVVPFTFETSVWDRLLAKIKAEPSFLEQVIQTPQFNVYSLLQSTGIDQDNSEEIGTTDGHYVAPAGSFDLATGVMRFVFPFHLENADRYSRITVSTSK